MVTKREAQLYWQHGERHAQLAQRVDALERRVDIQRKEIELLSSVEQQATSNRSTLFFLIGMLSVLFVLHGFFH